MAKNEMKKCTEWLAEQKKAMEEDGMGVGDQAVRVKLTQQKQRTRDVSHFRSTVDSALDAQKASDDAKKELNTAYKSVLALSERREGCLDTVSQVASMEGLIQGLSLEFDSKTMHLVNQAENCREVAVCDQSASPVLLTNETLARASQNCVQAVRANWTWMTQLWQCAQVHLRNAAAYHQFFHEAEEAEQWMNTTLSRIHLTFDPSKLQGDRTDALAIQQEIKDVLEAFLQWQTKTDYLFDKGKEIVPVPQRTSALPEERTVLALTDYSDDKITFIEGDVLFLVDNSDRKKWKVRNNAGETGEVPAVIILIPAPYGPAIETALRLRRQLLALWTGSVKRLGYQLIAFMLLVLRDWNQDEVSLLQRLREEDREDVGRVLMYLESTLVSQHWQGYGGFEELQSRIHRLLMIMEEDLEDPNFDNEFLKTVVIQIKTLEELLKKYQDFWTFWETYKTIVELVKHPELLLVCDKWDQLNYRATAHVVKFWDTNLDLDEGSLSKQKASLALLQTPSDVISDVTEEEELLIQQKANVSLQQAPSTVKSDVTIDETHQDFTTETVRTSVVEQQYTYVVKAVVDPRDGKSELDYQTAILLGIVDQAQRLYVNPTSGESMSMQQAMAEGKLVVEMKSVKKLSEENKAYGLLTIRITKESRPYTINGVRDPRSPKKTLTVEEATQNGVLTKDATYRTASGATISLSDAIDKELLDVTYHDSPVQGAWGTKSEVVSKTYAVWGVVNQRKKQKVSFPDAVALGLLDREKGEYVNNVTQERMPAQTAIMRGFIKARYVADPSKLDIDPRNTIVVQKLEKARKKLMREIHTIQAFKAMARLGH